MPKDAKAVEEVKEEAKPLFDPIEYQVETQDEKQGGDTKGNTKPDVDDIRKDMAEKSSFLDAIFGGNKEANKPGKEDKSEDSQEEGREEGLQDQQEQEVAEIVNPGSTKKAKAKQAKAGKKSEGEVESAEGSKESTAPALDPIEIATEAAKAATKGAIEAMQAKQAPAQKAPALPDYPEEFAERGPALDFLARANPKKYGDIRTKLAEYDKAKKKYVSEWKKENPGKEWDQEEDESFTEFDEQHFPDIDAKDLKKAERELDKQEIKDEVRREVLGPIHREKAEAALHAQTQGDAVTIGTATIKAIFPELEEVTEEEIKRISEDNPFEKEVIEAVASQSVAIMREFRSLMNGITPHSETNEAQGEAIRLMLELEEAVLRQPKAGQVRDGRRFTTHAHYSSLPPAEKSRHWVAGADDLQRWVSVKAASQARETWERRKQMLSKYTGGKLPTRAASPAAQIASNLGGGSKPKASNSEVVMAGQRSQPKSGFAGAAGSTGSQSQSGLNGFLRGIGVMK